VIRANLLAGKLSQPTQTFHVTRSTSRTLGKEEWEALEQRLVGWKTGLLGVLEVVKNARRSAGGAGGLSASAHNAEEDKTVGVAA
jgi:translation initiation factor 3 subunit M